MITLTPDAAEVVRNILASEDLPTGTALRMGVTSEVARGAAPSFGTSWPPVPIPPSRKISSSRVTGSGSWRAVRACLTWTGSSSAYAPSSEGWISCSKILRPRTAADAGTRSPIRTWNR